jgi:outer membrane receptor protein involved in Fe transport
MSGAFAGAQALAADASNAPVLEEIIVTAEKRSENLQDVPISVVAINAQQIKDAGITDIRNLAILTPGLTVTSEGNEAITTARIRGIGTVGDNPGLESSVGVNIDGVYRPRNGVAFGDLGEIEQIEVLYGPQGELFGKNNDAGVINVTTTPLEHLRCDGGSHRRQLQRSRSTRLGHGTVERRDRRTSVHGVPTK